MEAVSWMLDAGAGQEASPTGAGSERPQLLQNEAWGLGRVLGVGLLCQLLPITSSPRSSTVSVLS